MNCQHPNCVTINATKYFVDLSPYLNFPRAGNLERNDEACIESVMAVCQEQMVLQRLPF